MFGGRLAVGIFRVSKKEGPRSSGILAGRTLPPGLHYVMVIIAHQGNNYNA
jgi:hypothetical protein